MGSSSDAHCFACGDDTFLMLGGGMANHTVYAAWPVSCNVCAAVTTANFKNTSLVCEKCQTTEVIPFTDPSVWRGDGEETMRWGDLRLADGHYRCPKCAKFELRFDTDVGGHEKIMFD